MNANELKMIETLKLEAINDNGEMELSGRFEDIQTFLLQLKGTKSYAQKRSDQNDYILTVSHEPDTELIEQDEIESTETIWN